MVVKPPTIHRLIAENSNFIGMSVKNSNAALATIDGPDGVSNHSEP